MKRLVIAGLACAALMGAGCAATPAYRSAPTSMSGSILETRVYPILKDRHESEEVAARKIAMFQITDLVRRNEANKEYLNANDDDWVTIQESEGTLILTTTPAGHAQFEAALRALK